jgi:hypothetical protein
MPRMLSRESGVGDTETGQVWVSTVGTPPLRLSLPSNGLATSGANLLTNPSFTTDLSGWTAGANWAWDAAGTGSAKHTAGSTATLSQAVTLVAGETYLIQWTMSGRTAGTATFAIGANVSSGIGTNSTSSTSLAAPAASTTFTITPTSAFDGSIEIVAVQLITPATSVIATDGADSSLGELRMIGTHVGLGYQAASTVATSSYNTAVGYQALRRNGVGGTNTAIGGLALSALASGANNTVVGANALAGFLFGSNNTAFGTSAGWSPAGVTANATTTGIRQTLIGHMTGISSTTQRDDVVCLGYFAVADGNNAIAIGSGVSAGAAGSVAIGKDSAGTSASTTTANEIKIGTANHTTSILGSVAVGATPALSGALRISNSAWIAGRNAANTSDVNMWTVNSAGIILAGTFVNMNAQQITNAALVTSTAFAAGASPAASGDIRLSNGSLINVASGNTFSLGVAGSALVTLSATQLTLVDGLNIGTGTTTGIKIATATTQKLAFFGSTPVVQPASTADMRQALIDLGLYATGGATPLNLNGGTLTAGVVASGTNPSTTGGMRLANNTSVAWRNAGNSGDIAAVTVSASDALLLNVPSGSNGFMQVNSVNILRWNATQIIVGEGVNFAIGDVTGSKIGVTALQKIGFWNAAPGVQPTTAVAAATFVVGAGTAVNDASTFDGYTMKQVVKALRTIGLLA